MTLFLEPISLDDEIRSIRFEGHEAFFMASNPYVIKIRMST